MSSTATSFRMSTSVCNKFENVLTYIIIVLSKEQHVKQKFAFNTIHKKYLYTSHFYKLLFYLNCSTSVLQFY